MGRGAIGAALLLSVSAFALVSGCFTSGAGLEPPRDELYFPTALVVSPGLGSLYVANSDFDLQYNGGTVVTLDAPSIRGIVATIASGIGDGLGAAAACGKAGLGVNDDPLLNPGPCSAMRTPAFVKQSAIIGAFASGAALVTRQGAPGARLFVTVRGDPSLTYFDVVDDRPEMVANASNTPPCDDPMFCLDCGQTDTVGRCSAEHRVGDDGSESQRGLVLPADPVGVSWAPTSAGDAIVSAHQSSPAASLVLNTWGAGEKPTLEYFIAPLPSGPTEVAALPVPDFVGAVRAAGSLFEYGPGFMVTFRDAGELDLLRFRDDAEASPPRPFLTRAAAIGIGVNSQGTDSRGIAIDASARQACEAACPASSAPCLRACVDLPVDMYVANRSPASLLIGRIETTIVQTEKNGVLVDTGAYDTPSLYDTVPLSYGASKVAIGQIIGDDGQLHRRIFAVAFDSRLIFSYDPDARRIDSVIHTGRGPHAIAFDTGDDGDGLHSYMYIGHFTDSYIGVVDLDARRPQTFGSVIATVGTPNPPRESK